MFQLSIDFKKKKKAKYVVKTEIPQTHTEVSHAPTLP